MSCGCVAITPCPSFGQPNSLIDGGLQAYVQSETDGGRKRTFQTQRFESHHLPRARLHAMGIYLFHHARRDIQERKNFDCKIRLCECLESWYDSESVQAWAIGGLSGKYHQKNQKGKVDKPHWIKPWPTTNYQAVDTEWRCVSVRPHSRLSKMKLERMRLKKQDNSRDSGITSIFQLGFV